MTTYRPRGALSRAILHKFQSDAFLEDFDINTLYKMDKALPAKYQSRFIDMQVDDKTLKWLEESKTQSEKICLQLWFIFAKFFLSLFFTQTDLNGVLDRGSMFILSEDQIMDMLIKSGFQMSNVAKVLDIGAGDGHCTQRIQRALSRLHDSGGGLPEVLVTETSWIMRKRLIKYDNFSIVEVNDVSHLRDIKLVSCLNVLDRCADPHQMLTDIHHILSSSGRAVFALVLPYYHYVESNTSHLPIRPLLPHWHSNYTDEVISSCDCSEHQFPHRIRRPSFEDEARMFFELLEEKGFKIESWTKAPYLCEGDIRQSFYWLSDIVVVVSKIPHESLVSRKKEAESVRSGHRRRASRE